MKILVTGANGFLGKAVVWRLFEGGAKDVRCVVRPGRDESALTGIASRFPESRLEIVRCDLASRDAASRAVEGVEQVYHLAAGMRGSAADLVQNSVVASKYLLEGIGTAGVTRVCHVSSMSVYGIVGLLANSTIDEATPIEPHPERRDLYSFAKIRQERLFWEYRERYSFSLVVARPGVIYGCGGAALPARVGLQFPGVFVHMGCANTLPLTHVENCADAVALIGAKGEDREAYNVVDDDLPTSRVFFRNYRRKVDAMRYVSMPYWATQALSKFVESYHRRSKGQLPAVLTPYKSEIMWKGMRVSSSKLKRLGWEQRVPTREALEKFFAYWREIRQANGSR
jgi:nucleoside-diphosphate-sugar epimerase